MITRRGEEAVGVHGGRIQLPQSDALADQDQGGGSALGYAGRGWGSWWGAVVTSQTLYAATIASLREAGGAAGHGHSALGAWR